MNIGNFEVGQPGWQTMASAPRDGTIIEICCTYGRAPWYGRYRWASEMLVRYGETKADGSIITDTRFIRLPEPRWMAVDRLGSSLDDETHMQWRPTEQGPSYTDPTGGAQNTEAYWH